MIYDMIIIGGGPAGLTAAIYGRRNGRSVLLLEKEGFGGQIAFAPRVENYPGIPSVRGEELAQTMTDQVLSLDADTDIGQAVSVADRDGVKCVTAEDGTEYLGRAVILACGARHRLLGLPGEAELLGHGLSYCAVCDGSFYAGQEAAIVGGGDSALQEALLLSELCAKVYVLHRRREFRADAAKVAQLRARKNVEILTPVTVETLNAPTGELTSLTLRDGETGERRELPVAALFVSVGREPELEHFRDALPMTAAGYADVDEGCCAGAGLFVAGDCRAKEVRQLATAVGDGAAAAMAACRYLEGLEQET